MSVRRFLKVTLWNVSAEEFAGKAASMNPVFLEHFGEGWTVLYFREYKSGFVHELGSRSMDLITPAFVTVEGVIDDKRDWTNNVAFRHLIRRGLEEATGIPIII